MGRGIVIAGTAIMTVLVRRWLLALPLACVLAAPGNAADSPQPTPASPFAAFVDRYLDDFGRFHPSIAAGNGLHAHDGELEDFSAGAIAREIRWFHSMRRELARFDAAALTADERVDQTILAGIIDGWLLDLERLRNWTRNPMIYVAAVSDGVHDLVTMESSAPQTRLRNVISKLHGVPRLVAAARTNLHSPPRVFVTQADAMLTGVLDLLDHDLPTAFAQSVDPLLLKQAIDAAARAKSSLVTFQTDLQTRLMKQPEGSFVIGVENVEARYHAEELIDLPVSKLLAIGMRELAEKQREFDQAAARVDPKRSSIEVWRGVQADHPARGQVVPAARKIVEDLFAFVRERHLMTLPPDQHIIVAPAPAYDLGLASMHSSPPLEPTVIQSYFYITDADPSWSAERQEQWLRAFNHATLADISAHEVVPGHYVHSVYMRRTPGKIRRIWVGLNPFPQPSSGQDGWAHYAEQMVSDEGFRSEDPRYRMGQISEALIRICRLVAGIRLHSGEWSVDQATQWFESAAHLPPATAQREAVRGTYDPTYGGYFLGKQAALKLRRDYQAARGAQFSLQDFNERVMTHGIAPWWAHRQLLMPGDHGAVLD